jgi:hypothetical protein
MSNQLIRIRCPGCGSVASVSLAVGQQILCETCATHFLAPIFSPDDMETIRSSSTEFEVVGHPWRGFQDLPGSETDEPARQEGPGIRGQPDLGQTQQWQTVDWDQPRETQEGNRQLGAQFDPHDETRQPSAPPVSPDAQDADDAGSSRLTHMIVSFVCIAVIGSCLGGAIYILRAVQRQTELAEEETKAEQPVTGSTAEARPVRWTDASKAAQLNGRVIVKVETATYGAVRAKDLQRRVILTDDDNLIALNVSVLNRDFSPRPFTSWYGNTFEAADGEITLAELSDDQERTYQMLKFDDVSSLEGQQLADEIEQDDYVRDTLVFVVPEDVDRKKIKFFRLALPAVAVGLDGYYRFQIPVTMISGY